MTDWFTAGNWNPAAVPGSGQDVVLGVMSPNPTIIGAAGAAAKIITIGSAGASNGQLTIQGAGSLTTQTATIGDLSGSTGTVTVTGTGSTWTQAGASLGVGRQGTGTLTVGSGGAVNVGAGAGTLTIAELAGSTGTVNIGALPSVTTATPPGTLQVGTVQFGAGTGALNFRHNNNSTFSPYLFSPALAGNGKVTFIDGRTVLNTNSPGFTGQLHVLGTTIEVNGNFGNGTMRVGEFSAVEAESRSSAAPAGP